MSKWFFLIFIFFLFGCKKEIHTIPNLNPIDNNNNHNAALKTFSIRLVDTTTTTASVSWTAAADSSSVNSVTYSLYLDSNLVIAKIKTLTYQFSGLTPNKKYTLTIKAFNSTNDSISSTFSFTTKDNYLKFVNQILPVNNQIWGFAFSPDKGYIFTYQGSMDTLFTGNGTPGTRAFHVLKTDSLGNAKWTKTFTFPFTDIGFLIKTISDGYLILGSNFIIKIDFSGNTIWKNIFDTKGLIHLSSFVETQDKNIVITGVQSSQTPTLIMITLGSNGNITRQKTYDVGKPYLTIADLVEIPQDNSFIVLGTYGSKFGLWKIDMSGNFIWQNSFGDTLTSTIPTHIKYSGNQLIVSGSSVGDYYLYQMKMYRLDVNGNVINKILISDLHFSGNIQWFELTNDGGYVILTKIVETFGGGYNQILKYDSHDKEQWENSYDGLDYAKVIKQASDGGYIFPPLNAYSNTALLVKTNQYGKY